MVQMLSAFLRFAYRTAGPSKVRISAESCRSRQDDFFLRRAMAVPQQEWQHPSYGASLVTSPVAGATWSCMTGHSKLCMLVLPVLYSLLMSCLQIRYQHWLCVKVEMYKYSMKIAIYKRLSCGTISTTVQLRVLFGLEGEQIFAALLADEGASSDLEGPF